jgi:ATP-dependent DNA helicase DinG
VDMDKVLGADGALARHLEGFAPREAQQAMAEAVQRVLKRKGTLVCEAGTGTGKTFAYLAPALLSGGKVVVSTGTKNLQDQLFHRDLPLLCQALGRSPKLALLKGRANYLCPQRLEQAGGRVRSREAAAQLAKVRAWAGETTSGDMAEVGLPEGALVLPAVTSNADNCLGADCPHLERCHLARARRAAQQADLLVVNHHLLLADMALKDRGFGELLPEAAAFILDEAHQLPEVAAHFFGMALSARQLNELARDTAGGQATEAADDADLAMAADGLERAVADLRASLGEGSRRLGWSQVAEAQPVQQALTALTERLAALDGRLTQAAERGKELANCKRRCEALAQDLNRLVSDPPQGYVRWLETSTRAFVLHLTPTDVAGPFSARRSAYEGAWVLTSATLAVGGDFGHFVSRLGLADVETQRWESPFDFRRQAVLYVPTGLPEPRSPDYVARLVETVRPLLAASRGRAFLLFTSHRALQDAAERLRGSLDWPLLVQGEAARNELLERFRELGNAVLLGTSSFWEGVDVRGDALSLVVIDKLPFAAPGDPVIQARIEALRQAGQDPFTTYQLPEAVITLKQGVGRLIRDINDRGVLALADPRLLSKPYGRVFLDSLPPMTRTRKLDVVQRFFALERAGG